MKAHRYSSTLFNLGARWGCVVSATRTMPYPREIYDTQGQSGGVRKISPSPSFEPRTAQPVANRYTDYASSVPILILVRMVQN